MSKDNFTLFVGDLSLFCNTTHLKQAFSKYGEIRAVRIAFDEVSQKQLHFGFVEFTSYESALNALSMMNGTVLCGRILRVKWAINRNDNVNDEIRKPTNFKLETSSVHVNFLSYQTNRLVSEELLRNIFSAFGDVKDVIIKKSTKENNVQRGYGFVHYSNTADGIQSTLAAISNMYDVNIDNVNYTCAMSHACEQGFVQSGSPYPSLQSHSHSSYSSRQSSPYLMPLSAPAGAPTDGYYMQAPTTPYITGYPEHSTLPPNTQYFLYPAAAAPAPAMNYDQYSPHHQPETSYGYMSYVEASPAHHHNSMSPYYDMNAGAAAAPPAMMSYAPHHYEYQQPLPLSPMGIGYYNQPPPQQQQQHSAPSPQRLPPQVPYYRSGGHMQQTHAGPAPRPFLLSDVGRSISEPAISPRPSPRSLSGRQFHSSHELSPESRSRVVTPSVSQKSNQSTI